MAVTEIKHSTHIKMSLIFISFPERGKFCFCISKQLKSKERNHSQVWYHDPNLDYCITYAALQLNVCRFSHFQEVLQVRMKRIPVDIKIWIHVNKVLREQYKNRTSQKSTAMIKWDLKLAPWWTKHHYMILYYHRLLISTVKPKILHLVHA